jgi:flagellar basal-body rod protein FlgB
VPAAEDDSTGRARFNRFSNDARAAAMRMEEKDDMPQPTDLFGGTMSLLQRTLNLRSAQHHALSANIANADTPRYRSFEVAVDEELRKLCPDGRRLEMARTQTEHMPQPVNPATDNVKLRAGAVPGFSLRADGNTVDLDRAMGDLAENTLKYKTAAQLLSAKLKSLKNVIQGGK